MTNGRVIEIVEPDIGDCEFTVSFLNDHMTGPTVAVTCRWRNASQIAIQRCDAEPDEFEKGVECADMKRSVYLKLLNNLRELGSKP